MAATVGGFAYALVGPELLLILYIASALGLALFAFRPRHVRMGRHVTARRTPLRRELRSALVTAPVLLPILLALFLETLGNNAAQRHDPIAD